MSGFAKAWQYSLSKEELPEKFQSFAGINLIFIFKEAMNNVVRHAKANEVTLSMRTSENELILSLKDDGRWKDPDPTNPHYGLRNIEKRCGKNKFRLKIHHGIPGTQLDIGVPIFALNALELVPKNQAN